MENRFQNKDQSRLFVLLIFVASIIFYMPFMARQFIGDDWLWLANAKIALIDPIHFFSRAMYGYFRPLNMMAHSLIITIFGMNPVIYGFLSILLHSINIIFFWILLKKLTSNNFIIFTALIVFGFYCLDYSAIGWISVNHDLFVTGLSFLFALTMIDFISRPGKGRFVLLLCLGIAATLFKESGFATLGIYFLLMYLYRKSPFTGPFGIYTFIIIGFYIVYFVIYFITRVDVDKSVVFGPQVATNLWYYIIYLFAPIPERAISIIPGGLLGILKFIKAALTFVIPAICVYVYWKGDRAVRLFIGWTILFLLPVATFDLGIKLFDLYPQRTISRFMYSAIPGFSVIIGVIIAKLFSGKGKVRHVVLGVLLVIFLTGNWLIIKKSSELFFSRQRLSTKIVSSLNSIKDRLSYTDRIYILDKGKVSLPDIIRGCFHIEAIAYALFDKKIDVSHTTEDEIKSIYNRDDTIVLYYLSSEVSDKCLLPLEKDTGIYPAYYISN